MGDLKVKEPYTVHINDVKSVGGPYGGQGEVNSLILRKLVFFEGMGDVGAAILEPGLKTVTFSSEEKDDGTAEHYYGPFHEFYYVICGEFAVYWGKNVNELKQGTSEKMALEPGDVLYLTPGWKYLCKNTGIIPGMFIYGFFTAPGFEHVKRRGLEESTIHYLYPHLKRERYSDGDQGRGDREKHAQSTGCPGQGEFSLAIKPKVLNVDNVPTSYEISVPVKILFDFPKFEIGMCVEMEPGKETVVWSFEEMDDRTCTSYYGPCHEFYYLLDGEYTIYWGHDAKKLKAGTSDKIVMHPGDLGYWIPGWKYKAKNTGNVAVKLLYGVTHTPPGYTYRRTPGLLP